MQDEISIFDKILSAELSCDKVYEDDNVLAFHDKNPQAPVHVLVIPKKKMLSFADLPSAEDYIVATLFKKAALIAKQLGLEELGYRVVINNGFHGMQSVFYLHLHILGGRILTWPPG